ncbi:MAG: hypothetical protein KatS3mg108_1378 [Isosphaeraceae bacterium]|nr:MAG: hypothetical protein KatS3mg108_1378 [Isosphaeraceae bacterium]
MRATRSGIVGVLLMASPLVSAEQPQTIHVVVWDERQPEQKAAYDGRFLGDFIAAELARRPGIVVESVGLDDPDQGLTRERLEAADVLIWWSHLRDREFDIAKARRIVERVQAGKLSLVVLHSGFAGYPFREALQTVVEARMNQALADAMPKPLSPTVRIEIRFLYPGKDFERRNDEPYDPAFRFETKAPDSYVAQVRLPAWTIAAWREDGKPSRVRVVRPDHPIAAGLPAEFVIPQTEMYAEPFHVPDPDLVILEERWETGETFRSGCLWRVGNGYVFYLRPGHETYPVYKNREPMKLLENAVRYLGAEARSSGRRASPVRDEEEPLR